MNKELEYEVFRDYNKVQLKEAEEYLVSAEQEMATLKDKLDKAERVKNRMDSCGCLFYIVFVVGMFLLGLKLFFDGKLSNETTINLIYAILTVFFVSEFVDSRIKKHFYYEEKDRYRDILADYEYYKEYITDVDDLNKFVILSVNMIEGQIYVTYKKPSEKQIFVKEFNKKDVVVAEDKDSAEIHIYCDKDTNPYIRKIIVPYGII